MVVTLNDLHYYMNLVNIQYIYIYTQSLMAGMQGLNSVR